jgi:cytochrome c oxidase subunit 2
MQHAKMAFYIVAEAPDVFAAWRAANSAPSIRSSDSIAMRGQRVFLKSGCSLCHTIAGTEASGTIGPSLSHVASRSTLAAGTLPNTTANLMGWIGNPAALKPGTHMPALPLTGDELRALAAYLETLR